MAIRQVGGAPVYVIEVDVPKVTDARGRSYGNLVSDQRWKLWEEVQNSELQKMKFEQMTKQAQLDILEQKQRDVSRAIRDAREIQSKVRSGAMTVYQAAQLNLRLAGMNQPQTVFREEPARSPLTGLPTMQGEEGKEKAVMIESKTRTVPQPIRLDMPSGQAIQAESVSQAAEAEQIRADLDTYISKLEEQEKELGQQFQQFVESSAQAPDLLSRTRGAFQSQIGEGGFGISRRPLRQLPRFDELAAVGLLDETIARAENQAMMEEKAMVDDAASKGINIIPDTEQNIKRRAREELARQLEGAGATPTGRAGFLMKELPPPPPGLLPRQETRVPTGRFRDDFAVETQLPALDRRQEILRDLDRVGLGSPEASGLIQELEDFRRVQRANVAPPPPTPAERAMENEVFIQSLPTSDIPPGIDPETGEIRFAVDRGLAEARRAREEAIRIQQEEELLSRRLARDRGFTLPIETIAGVPTTTGGRPGGIVDRMTAARLARAPEVSPVSPPTPVIETPTPITPSPVETPATPAGPPPLQETLEGGYLVMRSSKQPGGTIYGPAPGQVIISTFGPSAVSVEDFNKKVEEIRRTKTGSKVESFPGGYTVDLSFEGGGTIYGPNGLAIISTFGPSAVSVEKFNKKVEQLRKAKTDKEVDDALRVKDIKKGGTQTLPQRQELYALKTIKKGIELAEKPKQFARLAKTDNPSAAPEYVKIVNGVYEVNSSSPQKFKLTYDEIAKTYKNDPATREKALSYLIAKDSLESNITRPIA